MLPTFPQSIITVFIFAVIITFNLLLNSYRQQQQRYHRLSTYSRLPVPDGKRSSFSTSLIPHKVHQTGKKFSNKYSSKWIAQAPDYGYYFYDDYGAALFVKEYTSPEIYEVYYSLPMPVMRADFFRYIVLMIRGGVYSDVDTEPLKPLVMWDPLVSNDVGLIVGIEDDRRVNPTARTALDFQLTQWTIAAKPYHPALIKLVHRITNITRSRLNAIKRDPRCIDIMTWTGPSIFTQTLLDYMQNGTNTTVSDMLYAIDQPTRIKDVLVLPRKAFANLGHEESDSWALVKHHFSGSWKQFSFTGLFQGKCSLPKALYSN